MDLRGVFTSVLADLQTKVWNSLKDAEESIETSIEKALQIRINQEDTDLFELNRLTGNQSALGFSLNIPKTILYTSFQVRHKQRIHSSFIFDSQ